MLLSVVLLRPRNFHRHCYNVLGGLSGRCFLKTAPHFRRPVIVIQMPRHPRVNAWRVSPVDDTARPPPCARGGRRGGKEVISGCGCGGRASGGSAFDPCGRWLNYRRPRWLRRPRLLGWPIIGRTMFTKSASATYVSEILRRNQDARSDAKVINLPFEKAFLFSNSDILIFIFIYPRRIE